MTGERDTLGTLRLALTNSVAFGATTIMPLWVSRLPIETGAAPATVALAATLQLGACAVANVVASYVLRSRSPVTLVRGALALAVVAGVIQAALPIPAFTIAAVAAGIAFGVVLNATNRIVAGSDHAQHGYALFQIVEVCVASSLFFGGALLVERFGAGSLFLLLSAGAAAALLVLTGYRAGGGGRSGPPPGSASGRAAVLLAAVLLFFVGQSSINSFLIPIGERAGLSAAAAASVVASGMVMALAGAVAARIVGMRFGLRAPVLAIAGALALDFVLLPRAGSTAGFVAGVVVVMAATITIVPYFFTALAEQDRSGRYAAIAPAFLLGGVALGPSLAVQVAGRFGYPVLGGAAAAIVLAAAALFVVPLGRGPLRSAS